MCSLTTPRRALFILFIYFQLILDSIVRGSLIDALCENASAPGESARESENTVKDLPHSVLMLLIISRLTGEETAHGDVTSRTVSEVVPLP